MTAEHEALPEPRRRSRAELDALAAPALAQSISGLGMLAGAANVIMQLANPAVGYGVVESKVDSGNIYKHPFKRTRTTLTYIAVAVLGSADDRRLYRQAVNESHRHVRSGPQSPVQYNAFSVDLQLWVAACLYKGFEDIHLTLTGPLGDRATQFYRDGAVFGTTLQVPYEAWPEDRAAFERYWQTGLAAIAIDDTVGDYLRGIATLTFAPRLVSWLLGRFNLFMTTGFLPAEFRAALQLPWDPARQKRFDRAMRFFRAINRWLPAIVRRFPFNFFLWDLRRRVRRNSSLV